MWNEKLKALTFSFDDGVEQDKRLIKILNKYGLRATFNINSALLGIYPGKVYPEELNEIYKEHEVAVHTLTHPNLTELPDDEIIYQVEEDRKNLIKLCGYEVVGMAYPCGGVNNNDRVAKVIKENTGVKYSRTVTSTGNFDLQSNLLRFNPTVYYTDKEKLFELGKKFVDLKADKPQILYVWGHAYELDGDKINWNDFEEFCKLVSSKQDIFYGTNKEVLL